MSTKSQAAGASSVTDMHRENHEKVNGLFEEIEQADNAKAKQRTIGAALTELGVPSKEESELINPEILPEIDNDDLRDDTLNEHHGDERDNTTFTVWDLLRPDG
jgi:hypothetical protein